MKEYYQDQATKWAYIRAAVSVAIQKDIEAIGTLGDIHVICEKAQLLNDILDIVDEKLADYRKLVEKAEKEQS